MKKRIVHILVFVVFLVVGFIYLNKVFSTHHIYNNTFNDFRKVSKKDDIDILFLGSSHVYTAYNPLIINNVTKLVTYNLGSDGQRLPITNLVFEKVIKHSKPKLAIVEIYEPSLKYPKENKVQGFQLRALDHISNFSIKKLKKTIKTYDKKEFLGVYSPLIRNHRSWNKLNFLQLNREDSLNNPHYFYYNGFFGRDYVLSENNEKFKTFKNIEIDTNLSKKLISKIDRKTIKEFVNIANENGIKVLVITSPYLRARYEDYPFFDALNRVCSQLNVPYLNLNNYYNEMNLEFYDFSDPLHLNSYGAYKASHFIADYIAKNYILQNPNYKTSEIEKIKLNEFNSKYSPNSIKTFSLPYKANLKDNIVINELKIKKINETYFGTILFKDYYEIREVLNKYKVGVHIRPRVSDTMLLKSISKENGRNFDLADFYLKDQGKNSVTFRFDSEINNIEELKFFLYDADGYKGVVGDPLIINDISF